MESDARYIWVGAIVLLLAVAIVAAAGWLLQPGGAARYQRYTIYFERLPLDGLAVGADVEMRGVKVGDVADYAITPENINRVRVVIRVDRRTPVSTNTVAGIDRNYVTRVSRVALQTPGTPGPPLTATPPGEPYPVIPEGRSELAEVTRTLRGLGEQSAEVMDALREVLSDENRASVREILANSVAASAELRARLARLDRTLATFDRAAASIGDAGARLGRSTETIAAELTPTVREARNTLAALGRAAGTLETESAALSRRLGDAAAQSSDQLATTAIELRRSAAAIARAVESLENPGTALIGPGERQLGPGERLR